MDEVDRSLEKLGKVIEQVAEAGATERKRAKEQTVEIGFAVAQELAAGAIGAEPERVASLVGSAMSLLMGEGPFRVRLHPDLFKAMQEKGLLARLVEGSKVTVSPDPGLEESGCVVESDSRKVDAGVQTHLRRLRHLFEQDGGGR
jgi:flagellar biosynthesis/type III secretory pathway protein FliH